MTVETLVLGGRDARHFLTTRWHFLLRHDAHASLYQSPGYLTAHARHLPPTATPLVLVAHRGTTQVAALALAREQRPHSSLVTALGAPHAECVRPVGPGSEDPEVALSLVREVRRFARNESVRLTDVPLESALGQHLTPLRGWRVTTDQSTVVPLPVPHQELDPSARYAHRQRQAVWRNLEDEGRKVAFELCFGAALPPAWEELIGLYRAQHGSTKRPLAERQMLDVLTSTGVFVAQLSVDGVVVAADLCLRWRERVYALLPTKNPDWSHCSPSHALLYRLTEELGSKAGRHGVRVLDLGRTRDRTGQRVATSQYGAQYTATVTVTSTSAGAASSPRIRPLTHLQRQGAA